MAQKRLAILTVFLRTYGERDDLGNNQAVTYVRLC